MLKQAQRELRAVLTGLRDEIDAGVPVVGLEPSCVAVFRDELLNLFPDDARARKLSANVFTLAEFLARRPDFRAPPLKGKALVHDHCHQKALIRGSAQKELLAALGLDAKLPDSGCCGLAGSFGFEHYDISMRIGEQDLLPAVREAAKDTLIIADGFSCRAQIEHATDRRALHCAEVLQMALHHENATQRYPEVGHVQGRPSAPSNAQVASAVLLGIVLAGAALYGVRRR